MSEERPTYGEYVVECARLARWRRSVEDRIVAEACRTGADPGDTIARLYARCDLFVDEAWAAFEAGTPLPRPDLSGRVAGTKGPNPSPAAGAPRGARSARSAR